MKEDRKCLVEVRVFEDGVIAEGKAKRRETRQEKIIREEPRSTEAFMLDTLNRIAAVLGDLNTRVKELENVAAKLNVASTDLKSGAGWAASNMPTEIRMMYSMISELHAAFLEDKGAEEGEG